MSGKKLFVFFLSIACALPLACGGGAPSVEKLEKTEQPLNVIIITLDTTRADHLGCYGGKAIATPEIDKIASEGVLFEKAFAPTPLTLPSHVSIMTGLYPLSHGVHNNGTYRLGEEAVTLAEVFTDEGYRTAAIIGAYPLDAQYGLNQGFEVYDDNLLDGKRNSKVFFQERKAAVVADKAVEWIVSNAGDKFFLWTHFFDPHMPYDPPPPFSENYAGNLYDGEIAYADYCLGKIFRKLDELGLREKTLVVITADHGESLNEHGEDSHGFFIYNSTVHVPMILSLPGLIPEAVRPSAAAGLVDIYPTVLDVCGMEVSAGSEGESLVPYIFDPGTLRKTRFYIESYLPYENFGWDKLEGTVSGEWKFIDTTRDELYNLNADWTEGSNLIDEHRKIGGDYRSRLDRFRSDASDNITSRKTDKVAPSEVEKLKSLGYLGVAGGEKSEGSKLKDPKDMIKAMKYIKAGEFHFGNREWENTAKAFNMVLDYDGENVYALTMLGKAYANQDKEDLAVEHHLKALSIKPDFLTARTNLASVYANIGKEKRAIELAEEVLEVYPNDPITYTAMGSAYEKLGDLDKAIGCFEKAVEYDPYHFENLLKLGNLYTEDGQYDRAEEVLTRHSELAEDTEKTDVAIGALYFKQGLYTKALNHFQNLLKDKPNKLIAYYYIGVSHKRLGNLPEASSYLKTFVENWKGKEEYLTEARKEYAEIKG